MTNHGPMLRGAGGALLVILGAILLGRDGALFLLGFLALLAGVGLAVTALLQLTEAPGDSTADHHEGVPTAAALFNLQGVKQMSATSQWTAGAVMGVIALLGLFLFSRAGDGMFALFGGLLFLFGLAGIVVFVHQATDYSTPAADVADAASPATESAATRDEDGQAAA